MRHPNTRSLLKVLNFICSLWKDLLESEGPPTKEELVKWESELSQLMNSERDHLEDIGKHVQRIYETNTYHPTEEVLRYDDEGIPLLGPYVFGTV